MDIIGYVTTDFIVDRFKQDYSFFEDADIPESAIIEWIGSCLLKLPSKGTLATRITDCDGQGDPCIVIEDYKGDLPCDIIELMHVRDSTSKRALKYSTDLYITHKEPVQTVANIYEYSIKGNTIFTNMKEGSLEIVYLGLALDDNKKPLIPNDENIIDCVTLFLAKKIAQKLWMLDKLAKDKYVWISGQYMIAKKKAKNTIKLPSVEDMYNISNRHNSLTRSVYIKDFGYRDKGFYSR